MTENVSIFKKGAKLEDELIATENYVDTLHSQVTQQLAEKANQTSVNNLYTQKNNIETYTPTSNVTPKAIYRVGSHYFVLTKKSNGKGYIRYRLRTGVVTTTVSYGGSAMLLRIVEVLNALDAFVLQKTNSAVNDEVSWGDNSFDYLGTSIPAKLSQNNNIGNYIEYTVSIPEGVYATGVLISKSGGSSETVEISVDGNIVQTKSFRDSAGGSNVFYIPITPGSHVIRFENKSAGRMNIAGINVTRLENVLEGLSHDAFYGFHSNVNPYVTNAGSMDYAMVEAETGLYCGSYHGGETRQSISFIVDGKTIPLNDGDYVIGNVIEIEQATTIIEKLQSFTRQTFKNDGSREFEVVFDGDINLTALFTNMTTTHSSFDEVVYPNHINVVDGLNTYLYDTNYVIQKSSSNNQKIITVMNNKALPIGKAIKPPYVRGSSSYGYNKLYRLNIDSDEPVNFKGGGFKTVHIFE